MNNQPKTGAMSKRMEGETRLHDMECRAFDRNVAEINAWLADKTSAFARLVPARLVNGETRRRRV